MSKYTTELRFICESESGYELFSGLSNVRDIINKSWDKIFDFDFPIFDDDYRELLCKKILMHYYTREIGLETVGLWKLKLETKMNEIMPYFNQLYKSALLDFNPLYDADYTKEHKGKGSGSGENTSTESRENSSESSGTNWNVYSDTPQGALTNVANETYLTNATKNTGSSEASGDSSVESSGTNSYNSTDEYIDHVVGKFPGVSYSKLIENYRKIILNIDMQVIDALGDLFMKLW